MPFNTRHSADLKRAYGKEFCIKKKIKIKKKEKSPGSAIITNRSPSQTPRGRGNRQNPNKHKPNKRKKSTKISSLFPKRGNRNTKRTEKHKNKMTHGKTYNKSPRRINHKATKNKTNTKFSHGFYIMRSAYISIAKSSQEIEKKVKQHHILMENVAILWLQLVFTIRKCTFWICNGYWTGRFMNSNMYRNTTYNIEVSPYAERSWLLVWHTMFAFGLHFSQRTPFVLINLCITRFITLLFIRERERETEYFSKYSVVVILIFVSNCDKQ